MNAASPQISTIAMSESKSLLCVAARLAWQDWLHEFGLSFCAVLALASILSPLLILHGVRMGVVERLRANLMRDPAVLVIVPQGSSVTGYDEGFLEKIRTLPGIRYVIGRTRDVAAEIEATSATGKRLTLFLDATSEGDPLLENFAAKLPNSSNGHLEIALSASAAKKLAVQPGDQIETVLARRQKNGRLVRLPLKFMVVSVLPPVAHANDIGLVDMETLVAIQNFRDGLQSELLASEGENNLLQERRFAAFRAYATGLDAVEDIEKWFLNQDIKVNTRSRDIAAIRKIDSTLGAVIMLIAVAGMTGFFAFIASSSEASVRRKWKQMGMLRLSGFSRISILAFPLAQTLITGVSGCLLAFGVYGLVAACIDFMFASETGGESICSLSTAFLLGAFLIVQIIALIASFRAAIHAAKISPASVIREN